ncbi:MAG: response regulator [Actinomycetota bacterium]
MTRNPANARILIVDDQEIHIRLLRYILTEAGFTNITGFTDAREALASFERIAPDIVLLDLMMHPLDGFGTLRQMHALMAEDDIVPVVILTADVNPEHRRLALELGAKDFLEKPFDHDEVVLRIKNLLEMRLLHTKLRDLAAGRVPVDEPAPAVIV